ncbi:hypothetical protein SteCoe_6376 [Stentor coeruleus]|uniref:Uncharacterized protein n=1 Tax=Stentor coeruleus TaxID=5963 RepID=A0A1R2CQ39_9CILI|nr:hypothetical protein SteCoe_6376 [Stentor coeruleus]
MNRKASDSFLNEVTERVMKLKQISEESGLDCTQELVRTLGMLSEISKSSTSVLDLSDDSLDLNVSNLILQPTNSILEDFSIDSQTSLITSIRNKNNELQKTCSQKLLELRSTAKEFTKSRQGLHWESPYERVISNSQINDFYLKEKVDSRKESVANEEMMTQKVIINRSRSNTQEQSRNCICESALDNILGELSQLKNDLSNASNKLLESNNQILKQHNESIEIKAQLEILIENHSKTTSTPSCGCKIF